MCLIYITYGISRPLLAIRILAVRTILSLLDEQCPCLTSNVIYNRKYSRKQLPRSALGIFNQLLFL